MHAWYQLHLQQIVPSARIPSLSSQSPESQLAAYNELVDEGKQLTGTDMRCRIFEQPI